MKKLISLLLAAVLVFSVLPVNAQAAKGDKLVALTFDDGPHKTYTKQLLDGLKERGVHVTFFMVGNSAERNTDLVQRAYDEGHEIGNHTYDHPNLNTLSGANVASQLARTNTILDKICGTGTRHLVRPPYGNANATVVSAINGPVILWSVDSGDWRYGYSHVYREILNKAADGAIIGCHDTHSYTVTATLNAIDVLLAQGYEFVTISELFRRRGITLKNGVKYHSCQNNGVDLGPVEAPEITYELEADGVRITIESPSDAPVYYTTDGSRLTQQSKIYTGSFVVKCPVEIRAAAAFNLNGGRSEEVTLKLELPPCATPKIDIANGVLTLSCATSDAPIYYTLNGTKATANANRYTGPVSVEPGTVIRAVAGGGEYAVSQETVLYYSENGNLFSDVLPSAWYADEIDRAVSMGLMNGVEEYKIDPNGATTRAMVVTMLYRYVGAELSKDWSRSNTFTDVAEGQWYADAVEWAYINQIVDGYPDNTFKPNQSISRQEMAKMIANFLACRENDLPDGADCRSKFKDGNKIAAWALSSVNAVVAAGLMQGDTDGNLNPQSNATRAEFATVLLRMIDLEETMNTPADPAE